MSPTSTPSRAGWGAVVVASLVGLVASLAIFGLGQRWIVTFQPADWVGWLVLVAAPTIGGVVAGYRTRGGTSPAVGSGLLVGLWLGFLAVHVGIAQAYDGIGGDQAAAWIVWGIVGTPFLMLASGVGGLFGTAVAGIRVGKRGRPTNRAVDADSTDADSTPDSADDAIVDRDVPLVGIGRATLEGVGTTFAAGLLGIFAGPVALGAPLAGGFVAGHRSPGRAGLGAFCGLAAGIAFAAITIGFVVLELRSQTYVGVGGYFALLFLLVIVFVGIVLGALGGFVGGMVADDEDEPTATADTAES